MRRFIRRDRYVASSSAAIIACEAAAVVNAAQERHVGQLARAVVIIRERQQVPARCVRDASHRGGRTRRARLQIGYRGASATPAIACSARPVPSRSAPARRKRRDRCRRAPGYVGRIGGPTQAHAAAWRPKIPHGPYGRDIVAWHLEPGGSGRVVYVAPVLTGTE